MTEIIFYLAFGLAMVGGVVALVGFIDTVAKAYDAYRSQVDL